MATHVKGAKVSTRWYSYEPAARNQTATNHWSIMKENCTTFSAYAPAIDKSSGADRYQIMKNGSVVPISGEPLDAKLKREISLNLPEKYSEGNRRPVQSIKKYKNDFNLRAKDGFKFWYQPKPLPTKFGRYGLGGYKTYLGIGSAPRS